jgi:hypothetical protein
VVLDALFLTAAGSLVQRHHCFAARIIAGGESMEIRLPTFRCACDRRVVMDALSLAVASLRAGRRRCSAGGIISGGRSMGIRLPTFRCVREDRVVIVAPSSAAMGNFMRKAFARCIIVRGTPIEHAS